MIIADPKPEKPRTMPAAMIAPTNHHNSGKARAEPIRSGINVGKLISGRIVRLVPVSLNA